MSDDLTTSQPGELSYSHWSQVKAISWSGHSLSLRSQCVQSTAGCEGSIESCTVCLLAQPRLDQGELTSDTVIIMCSPVVTAVPEVSLDFLLA